MIGMCYNKVVPKMGRKTRSKINFGIQEELKMGALFFFLAFVLLIPVCVIGMEVLVRLGILDPIEDPAEWDFEEPEEEGAEEVTYKRAA